MVGWQLPLLCEHGLDASAAGDFLTGGLLLLVLTGLNRTSPMMKSSPSASKSQTLLKSAWVSKKVSRTWHDLESSCVQRTLTACFVRAMRSGQAGQRQFDHDGTIRTNAHHGKPVLRQYSTTNPFRTFAGPQSSRRQGCRCSCKGGPHTPRSGQGHESPWSFHRR